IRRQASVSFSTAIGGNDVSIKVKASTLSRLKLLKTIEAHRSYAELVAHLLDTYIEQADPDLKNKMAILQDQR
ncbi:hypothetical protein, partial [Streptococcus sp. S784/96/1]|uniref:hypothetical protein n=1 Tax=Streptococcus sp. S784/96/1 TaxID=2653499 RepID=UPI00138690F3